ncbi:Isoleucine--tRNA ligase, mitochondrial [Holothuria leucospilota]|uniref:Isoleucine--tRNA ligase, mitochondrial n=1 Tax=Holothuria leucospilota TaxID=206669 RepID=A0A9Q1BRY7_HOLLE|nr:Isoleucine--tRNA ligase, mitochondrial [Holothuria leucospilota]
MLLCKWRTLNPRVPFSLHITYNVRLSLNINADGYKPYPCWPRSAEGQRPTNINESTTTGLPILTMRNYTERLFAQPNRRFSSKKYSKTLKLPQTSFELWGAGKRETDVQKVCRFDDLYTWQSKEKRSKEFCLHDGPPYANGDPHLGHAVNKILKDIINRYKLLCGYKIHYVPGWDCHGLPIELKAISEKPEDFQSMKPQEIREKAKKFAKGAIKKQMSAFKRWGVMADWKNCYYTFDKEFEASQLELFYKMYSKGVIFRDWKPVNWSPSSRTALAEAELEYNLQHVSPSIYVKFPLQKVPSPLTLCFENKKGVSCLIWTTTPWTIPANQAICYMPSKKYALVRCQETDDWMIVAAERLEETAKILEMELQVESTFDGSDLEGCYCNHPTIKDRVIPLLPAYHVKMSLGTGLVHTAPAHGTEDFNVGLQYKLPMPCLVDGQGIYTTEAGPDLCGKNVLKDGNEIVIEQLRSHNALLHLTSYEHSYPYDWRTKQPIIIRASRQWFVDTSAIKEHAEKCLEEVSTIPGNAITNMKNSLSNRSFWCISRQRVWGVPIPVFYHKTTGEPLVTRHTIEHIISLVQKHGTDCWWSLSMDELLPEIVLQKSNVYGHPSDYERGKDILDIWFDSGSTWFHVLKGGQADVYLEGEDQYGAWFQTSLLTSVALQNTAPYRSLLVHGFTLDGQGRKMSKSLGNVVDPDLIINGGKDKKTDPVYGADVLRWKVADSDWTNRVLITPDFFAAANQNILKIRNTLRYFLGNLHDFQVESDCLPLDELTLFDQYMLHLLHEYANEVTEAYERYDFSDVTRNAIDFIHNKVSALYLDTVKDRLYCEASHSRLRKSCQTVLFHMLEVTVRSLAPILPHLAEEVYLHYAHSQEDAMSVFKTGWFTCDPLWHQSDLSMRWEVLLMIRKVFHDAIKKSSSSRDHDVIIQTDNEELFSLLQETQPEMNSCTSELTELLMASFVSLVDKNINVGNEGSIQVEQKVLVNTQENKAVACPYTLVIQQASHNRCERCRKYTAPIPGQPCNRCIKVLADGWE